MRDPQPRDTANTGCGLRMRSPYNPTLSKVAVPALPLWKCQPGSALRLEHANLSVRDADAMTRFLQVIASDFRVRGEGLDAQGRPWRHVGNDEFYIALQTVTEGDTRTPYGDTPGLNHLGWEVESVNKLEERMRDAGFLPNLRVEDHPARIRLYFYDPEGNDWEFVEYLTRDPNQRNDYDHS